MTGGERGGSHKLQVTSRKSRVKSGVSLPARTAKRSVVRRVRGLGGRGNPVTVVRKRRDQEAMDAGS